MFGLTLGEADKQVGQRKGAGSNSYRSSHAKVLARLAAYPWALDRFPIDKMSYEKPSLQSFIAPHLGLIDTMLASDGQPLSRRPFSAAVQFVSEFVPEIKFGDERRSPGRPEQFILEPWFAAIHGHVSEWYHARYGDRMSEDRPSTFLAATLVSLTPFGLHVPTTLTEPGTPGETVLLRFPSAVLDSEDALSWIAGPPTWDTYEADAVAEARELATDVASLVRRIASTMLGSTVSDHVTRNVLAGVRIHLESAATLILRAGQEGGFARAQWELQMACESAFKGLLQQRTGRFPETHDLFTLFDKCQGFCPSASRELVRKLPRWDDAANLRYGIGDHPTVHGIFEWYRLALRLIAQTVDGLSGVRVRADGYIEVGKAPWLDKPNGKSV